MGRPDAERRAYAVDKAYERPSNLASASGDRGTLPAMPLSRGEESA